MFTSNDMTNMASLNYLESRFPIYGNWLPRADAVGDPCAMALSPFPPPDSDARMRNIMARTHEASLNTPEQHTTSQALWRRFTRSVPGNKWELLKIDLRRESVYVTHTAPRSCGVVRDFVPYASESLEQYWSTIETGFHAAFLALDDGTLFAQPGQLSAVRDMVALHFVRSPDVKEIHDETLRVGVESWRSTRRREPGEVHQRYREKTGILTIGDEAVEYILDKQAEEFGELAASGAVLRERLVNMYEVVRERLEMFAIEILVPRAGEFLIGDIPVVKINPGGTGPWSATGSIGLLKDDVLALPLGRGHLAWLHYGPGSGFSSIPSSQVEMLNKLQILAAREHVVAHPESGLVPFVARVHADSFCS